MKVGQVFRFSAKYMREWMELNYDDLGMGCELLERQSLLYCYEVRNDGFTLRSLYFDDLESGKWDLGCWYEDLQRSDLVLVAEDATKLLLEN